VHIPLSPQAISFHRMKGKTTSRAKAGKEDPLKSPANSNCNSEFHREVVRQHLKVYSASGGFQSVLFRVVALANFINS